MAELLNAKEQALLRGWMNQLGWPLLGQLYLDGADLAAARQAAFSLRQRLALRARQSNRPDLEAFWNKDRQAGESWLKQAEAYLRELLESPPPRPVPVDKVERWFTPRLANKLRGHGLETLEDLLELRQRLGKAWWKILPKFGAHSAQAVEQFLNAHADHLPATALALPSHPGESAAVPASGRVLLGLLESNEALSGAEGQNRAPAERCRIPAGNDWEAINAWLGLRDPASHTCRAYRKEAERFLLWAVAERNKALSSLDTLDCKAYREFLFDPPECWTNPRFQPRWSPDWRPFQGPLQPRTVKQAETLLSALCGWLVKQCYLDSNPFDGLPPLPAHGLNRLQVEHALDEGQWAWLLEYCVRCEADPPRGKASRDYRRLWIALQLAYCTGLRLAELAAARFGDIHYKSRQGGQYWLGVLGKGGRLREVPLPAALVEELKSEAKQRGIIWGLPDNPSPLIGKFRRTVVENEAGLEFTETPFTVSGLHQLLKDFFREAAIEARSQAASEEDRRRAEALEKMTAHWLRHTHASHALAKGAELLHVKENLGHASLATTSVYLHGDKDQRHRAMEGMFSQPARAPRS